MFLVWKASLNHLRHHPWQLALAVFGIMLGVSIVVAVQVTQRSAQTAFQAAQAALSGAATHRIESASGTIDEDVFAQLCLNFPDLDMMPIVVTNVELANIRGRWLNLYGFDPLTASQPQTTHRLGTTFDTTLITQSLGLVNQRTLAGLSVDSNNGVTLMIDNRELNLELRAIRPVPTDNDVLLDDVILVDIATAQELLKRKGQLSYIDLHVPHDSSAILTTLKHLLPPNLILRDLVADRAEQQLLTKAFDTNMSALSLLGLLVGMFLVYNTESFLVVQRAALYGRLRILGATPAELLSGVFLEALIIGAAASALGAALGVGLADGLLDLVTRTRRDFYYVVSATRLEISAGMLAGCFCAGIATTLLAAMRPAFDAADVALNHLPLHVGASRPYSRSGLVSVLILSSVLLLILPIPTLWRDFGFLLLALLLIATLIPLCLTYVIYPVMRAMRLQCAWPERLGVAISFQSRRRVDTATTALCLAAAVSLGMQLMTGSFRLAVESWLIRLLRADFYVTAESTPVPIAEKRLQAFAARLSEIPSIDAVSTVSRQMVTADNQRAALAVYSLPQRARVGYQFIAGSAQRVWSQWDSYDTVIVTEPYASHRGCAVGDPVTLDTPSGPRRFEVTGIYRDYSSERGGLAMSRRTFLRYWPAPGYQGLGVYSQAGAIATVRAALASLAANSPGLDVSANADLRRRALTVFDRTFLITKLLALLTLAVSLIGIIGALLAQQIECARDYSVLRALGIDRLQLARVIFAQTLLIGSVAATLALPIGVGVAIYLIRVINVHSFGWSMPLTIPASTLQFAWLGILGAAASATVYPVFHATRRAPACALNDE